MSNPFEHDDGCGCRTCKSLRILSTAPSLKLTVELLKSSMKSGDIVVDCIDFGIEHSARVLSEEYGAWLKAQGDNTLEQVQITGADIARARDRVLAEIQRRKAARQDGLRKN